MTVDTAYMYLLWLQVPTVFWLYYSHDAFYKLSSFFMYPVSCHLSLLFYHLKASFVGSLSSSDLLTLCLMVPFPLHITYLEDRGSSLCISDHMSS